MGYAETIVTEDFETTCNVETADVVEKKDNSEVIEKQEAYLSGRIERDAWIVYVANKLKGYYETLYRMHHMSGIVEHDDYEGECLVKICEQIDFYDATLATLTTFFRPHFLEAFNDLQKKSGKANSRHYEKQTKALESVAQKYGYTGILDPKLPPEKLSKLAGSKAHPLKTVVKTREYVMQSAIQSLDAVAENHDFESPFKDPQVIYLQNEETEAIANAVETLRLTSFEEFLKDNCITPSEVEKLSTKGVIRHLKAYAQLHDDDEVAKMDEKSFNAPYINSRIATVRKRLQDSLRKFSPIKEVNIYIENPVQASEDDLRKAFDLGDLF